MTTPLPLSSELLHKLASADLVRPDELLGAHPMTVDGVEGVRFAVWAPNAQHVSVVGDFNGWNGFENPLERLEVGFWGAFVAGAHTGQHYKFNVTGANGHTVQKADPYMQRAELRPRTASTVWQSQFAWNDDAWMRSRDQSPEKPISIYEVHLGSWARGLDNWYMNYQDIAHRLADYVTWMGYTHVELLGVMEHPFDGSWGYQVTGYYAPTERFGTPDDFKYLVNHLHSKGIGVILDWVPGHFPVDEHGLGQFDGQALYEYADSRKGYHYDWNTYIFDYGRNEVQMFLIGSALHWLEDYHIDGLRVDAVASMLFLDFSRTDWVPNIYGGNENLEAIAFLKRLNDVVSHEVPSAIMIAEESSDFAGVTTPAPFGLGFHYKWAMGWMNDSLAYIEENPLFRRHHHHKITFYNMYRTAEKYVLPISHDEVVHLKKSMLGKMAGDYYAQLAALRAFYAYMWTTPGKKLLFMGQEFAQGTEWNYDTALPWHLAEQKEHRGVLLLLRDLNRLYRHHPALHVGDAAAEGMLWVQADDIETSVYAYLRRDPHSEEWMLVVLNFTPVYREGYAVGVPEGGEYRVMINSDAGEYGGFGTQQPDLTAQEEGLHGQTHRLLLNLPPNSALILMPERLVDLHNPNKPKAAAQIVTTQTAAVEVSHTQAGDAPAHVTVTAPVTAQLPHAEPVTTAPTSTAPTASKKVALKKVRHKGKR